MTPEPDGKQTPVCPDCACSVHKPSWAIPGVIEDVTWHIELLKCKLPHDIVIGDNFLLRFEDLSEFLK